MCVCVDTSRCENMNNTPEEDKKNREIQWQTIKHTKPNRKYELRRSCHYCIEHIHEFVSMNLQSNKTEVIAKKRRKENKSQGVLDCVNSHCGCSSPNTKTNEAFGVRLRQSIPSSTNSVPGSSNRLIRLQN